MRDLVATTTPPDFTGHRCRCRHPLHYYKCRVDECDCPAQADKAIATDIGTTSNNLTEQARQLVEQWVKFFNIEIPYNPYDSLINGVASALAEAATQGQVVDFARAGSVAQMWATSHRAEIERRINELSPDASYLNRSTQRSRYGSTGAGGTGCR